MSQALQALSETDSELLGKKLLLHAVCESGKWRWGENGGGFIDGHNTVLARGLSPMDIVQQAILQTLDGTRPWDSEKYPDITVHLKWVVTSLTANLASGADNRRLRPIPEESDGAEAAALLETDETEAAEIERKVLEAVKDDAQLVEVLSRLRNGEKPREIASAMKLSDKEIYRLTQKLKRRLAPVLGTGPEEEL